MDSLSDLLEKGKSFLLMTHKDPDTDAIGSMLALDKALENAGKKVVSITEKPVKAPLSELEGSDRIVRSPEKGSRFDAVIALDCSDKERLGGSASFLNYGDVLINMDHHETNSYFGDIDLVLPLSSSTAEIVFRTIKSLGLPLDHQVAENIFAGVQGDTGSFRYGNTTASSFLIAAEMMEYGVEPWGVSRKILDTRSLSGLKLLEAALGTIELYHEGKVGLMFLSSGMFRKAGASREDSEGFGEYTRNIPGVEVSVLIRQTGKRDYKFSLRSNNHINVAQLASLFGGGGHARAAGFQRVGNLEKLKKELLDKVLGFLDDPPS